MGYHEQWVAPNAPFEEKMNKKSGTFPIAAEGFPFILASLFVTVLLAFLPIKIPALIALGLTVFIICFFRNPDRYTPKDPAALVAPADGRIVYLGEAKEGHTGEDMIKVSIFMSVFNVHVNRSPIAGVVQETFYKRGKFLDARHENATFENEQSGIVVETETGKKVVFVQVAGLIARRIISYARKGDILGAGERYGLIRFGSRVDLYFPKDSEIRSILGQRTVAGETVIGYLR